MDSLPSNKTVAVNLLEIGTNLPDLSIKSSIPSPEILSKRYVSPSQTINLDDATFFISPLYHKSTVASCHL